MFKQKKNAKLEEIEKEKYQKKKYKKVERKTRQKYINKYQIEF